MIINESAPEVTTWYPNTSERARRPGSSSTEASPVPNASGRRARLILSRIEAQASSTTKGTMETRSAARSSAAPLAVSPNSSPQSFQSARTIGSSPLKPSSITNTPTPLYREVRNLPYELREQVTVYFEEGLREYHDNAVALSVANYSVKTSRLWTF